MSEERFHFSIPNENVRNEKYEKTGGGTSFQRLDYADHGKRLFARTATIKATAAEKKDYQLTSDMFLQIETPKDFSVKSEKTRIENLGFKVVSYSKYNKSIGTVVISKENVPVFESKLAEYIETPDHVGKSNFSIIENLTPITPEEKIKTEIDFESEEPVQIIINLYHILARKERLAIFNAIKIELEKYTKDVEARNFSNGVTSLACTLPSKIIPTIAAEFDTIKEIKPNYVTFVENSIPVEAMPNPLSIENPTSDSVVCIVDSGIKTGNGIFDTLVVGKEEHLPIGSLECHFDHGSFVASRCLFGDAIDNCLGTHILTPYCKVLDIAVFGRDVNDKSIGHTLFKLCVIMESIVQKYHDQIKVYNLSLGVPLAIRDFEVSDLAKILDYLSKEHKVLFIISAGNMDTLLGPFPQDHFGNGESRIGAPAESILGLTVGSIAKHINAVSLSEVNEISPFSRIGPGADLGMKPELVAHGGNLIAPYNYSPRVSSYGISADGKSLAVNNGTSFSAPLVAQYAQRLFDAYPNSDPNLVKGLLCHFTEKRKIHDELSGDERMFVGFGEPIIEQALQAVNNNAAYIYEGQLNQDEYQYVKFHIPDILAANNPLSRLRVKITITYDPPVSVDNDAEYSKARITALLTKPTDKGMTPINIEAEGKYLHPWNPILQFDKTFTRSYLTGAWELRLRLFTRGNIPADYLQDYSVVIEIIDENQSSDVYENIEQQFGEIYKKITIRKAAA